MGKPRAPLMMPEDRAILAYLAGIIDGEGSISILHHSGRYSPKAGGKYPTFIEAVQIANTNQDLMAWLMENIGGCAFPVWTKPGYRQQYRWSICGANVSTLLKAVLPYLVIKKQQAEIALEYRRGYKRCTKLSLPDERAAIYRRCNDFRFRLIAINQGGEIRRKKELILDGFATVFPRPSISRALPS